MEATSPKLNPLQAVSEELASIVERVGKSVVAVHARHRLQSSGVVWRKGLIVTAAHTIKRTEGISVTSPDGRSVTAALAGRDVGTDLAVLKVDGVDLDPAEIVAAVGAAAAGLVALQASALATLLPEYRHARGTAEIDAAENLTPREIEVLGMLAEGLGNKAIAARLGISEHTAKFHVGSILAKMGASSRVEAVTLGIRQGLIML